MSARGLRSSGLLFLLDRRWLGNHTGVLVEHMLGVASLVTLHFDALLLLILPGRLDSIATALGSKECRLLFALTSASFFA